MEEKNNEEYLNEENLNKEKNNEEYLNENNMNEEKNNEIDNDSKVKEEFVEPRYYTYENLGEGKIVSDINPNEQPKKKKHFFGKVVAVVLSAALFGACAGAGFYFVDKYYRDDKESEPVTVYKNSIPVTSTIVSSNTVESESDVADIVENVMPSVVSITCTTKQNITIWPGYYDEREYDSSGSGIIIGENDNELLIVTNNHVVEDTDSVQITFVDGESYDAAIKGMERSVDIAVCVVNKKDLKEETLKAIKVATIGDSSKLRTGELAIAIGNALGYGQSVTRGCISALSREVTIEDTTYTAIQTDAAINPGNSGGALLNGKGEVIGINSAKLARNEVEGMGYAIPISKVLPIIQDLMNKEHIPDEEKGYLGVTCSTVSKEISQLYKCPAGVMLTEIVEDGPADKAGLLDGDIVTKVDDIEISNNEQFIEKIGGRRAGDKVKITLQRFDEGMYREKTIELTLGKRPEGFSNKVPGNTPNK